MRRCGAVSAASSSKNGVTAWRTMVFQLLVAHQARADDDHACAQVEAAFHAVNLLQPGLGRHAVLRDGAMPSSGCHNGVKC